MALKITGRVIDILEEQSGTGRNGPWRKQDFILEIEGEYPAPVCITQWGENIEKFAVKEGETLTAHIDLRSREFNDRWYTDVKAWRVEREESAAAPEAPSDAGGGPGAPGASSPPPPEQDEVTDDDLPF